MVIDYLTIKSTDDKGRTWYEPEHLTVKQGSQYNAKRPEHQQYEFHELPGHYWEWNKFALEPGSIYEVTLTTMPNPGHNDYLDVRSAVLKTAPENGYPHEPLFDGPLPQDSPTLAPGAPEASWPQVEGIVKGHVEKIAVRLYVALFPDASPNIDNTGLAFIRGLRDRVYHQLTNQPIAPVGYCYIHEQTCKQGKTGAWGHRHEDTWCIDGGIQEPEAAEGEHENTTR